MADRDPFQSQSPANRGPAHWSISELATEFGVTTRALRFYEEEGLVTPRRVGGVRRYSRRDRLRLAWICRAKRVGFSLSEIRESIGLLEGSDRRTTLISLCRGRIAELERQRHAIDGMMAELTAFVASLEAGQCSPEAGGSR
jgi:DNA-binding transcriptional MerR regulator